MDIQRVKTRKLMTPQRVLAALGISFAAAAYALTTLDYSTLRVERDDVRIGTVQYGSLDVTVAANGVLLARDVELLSAQVDGTVKRILARAGANVNKGQVLVELDNPALNTEVATRRAEFDKAKAEHVSARIDIENQLLNQESLLMQQKFSLEKVNLELQAKQRLIATKVIPQIEYQQAELDVKQQTALVAIEEQRLRKSRENQPSQLAALDAMLQQAEQGLAQALTEQANLQLTATRDGVIQQMNVDIGQNLRAGEQVGRIADQRELYAQLEVPSLQASDLALEQRVELNTRNGLIEGRIARVDPAVLNGSVRVDVEINSSLPASARPELSVEGTIYVAEIRDSLYVERPAASRSNAEQALFVLDAYGKYATRTIVKLGRVSVNYVEVLAGLQAGDQIIISDSSDFQNQSTFLLTN
jgi:multidrug efflux pump subunit AcrA (membrane-fusion protein)